jgi:hypothetical protein
MSHPTKKEAIAALRKWQKHHEACTKQFDALRAIFGAISDTDLHESVWLMFDDYTSALSLAFGDDFEWLAWYANENDMGASGHPAGYDGKLRKIKSLADLYRLIEQGRDRA